MRSCKRFTNGPGNVERLVDWKAAALQRSDNGCPSASRRPRRRDLLFRQKQCIFAAFDLRFLNGRDLRPLPLIERKGMLKRLVRRKRARMPYLDQVESDGCLLFDQVLKMDLEGIAVSGKTRPTR